MHDSKERKILQEQMFEMYLTKYWMKTMLISFKRVIPDLVKYRMKWRKLCNNGCFLGDNRVE